MPNVQHKEIPFNGKVVLTDPASIGTNFRTLTNLRYMDTHVKGVGGMTKINTTALTTYLKTRSAYHFTKTQHAESHVLVQAYNSGETVSHVIENATAIPSAGAFSTDLWTDSTGHGRGRFSSAPDGQMIYANSVDACIWGGNETKVGGLLTTQTALSAAGDALVAPQDYTIEANNTKSDAANIFTCGGSWKTFLIGSTRPAKGAKIYVSSANASASTLVVSESAADGSWDALSVTADGTAVGGKIFAQTGSITWASTVTTTKPKYLGGRYLYWYQFTINAGSAGIYHVTLDLPFQSIVDIWDGIYRDVSRFYVYTTAQTDKTTNVLVDDYRVDLTSTYADLSSLTNAQYLEAGFTKKQTAIYLSVPSDFNNATASVAAVYYWDGDSYATVGDISDGTIVAGASLGKTGVISWNNTSIASEVKLQYANSAPLYYYKIIFTVTLDASVRVNYVAGIPAKVDIGYYKFPVYAQGRVLLCCDMAGDRNKMTCSGKFTPQVFNGFDSMDVYFGDDGELTAGTELFSQYGSSLYSIILMFKDNETWIIAGQDINEWENNTFLVSSTIGCPAPLTLKTINLSSPTVQNRTVAIWQGANGIYMSDGKTPIPIHGDIKEFFDKRDSRCINASLLGESVGWVDEERQAYHWKFASGTAATSLNSEWVYDFVRAKWFEIDRGADLQCGLTVHDTNGNSYNYGFLDTGYMERLEYGTDFDGTDITHTLHTGDIALADLATETRLSALRLIAVAKTVTSNSVTLTHYGDTSSTGTDKTMSPASSGYRVAIPKFVDKFNGDPFHSFKFVMVTDDETIGFEPIIAIASFHPVHGDN